MGWTRLAASHVVAATEVKPDVLLAVTPTPGHTIPKAAHDETAVWLRQLRVVAPSSEME